MTSAGYFFITIVLMIGVIMGDNQSFTVGESNYFGPFSQTLLTLQLFLFNFFGFLFFIAMGSEQIDAYKHAPSVSIFRHCVSILILSFHFTFQGVAKARAMGSMAILTSFVFLVDTVFNILAMWNSE